MPIASLSICVQLTRTLLTHPLPFSLLVEYFSRKCENMFDTTWDPLDAPFLNVLVDKTIFLDGSCYFVCDDPKHDFTKHDFTKHVFTISVEKGNGMELCNVFDSRNLISRVEPKNLNN